MKFMECLDKDVMKKKNKTFRESGVRSLSLAATHYRLTLFLA